MYLPEEGHPAYGVVRTYVKDFNDEPDSPGAQTWLDSGEPWLASSTQPAVHSLQYTARDVSHGKGGGA
jgi:hypothetical protein